MNTYPTAITQATFFTMIDEWIGVINRHESASVFNMTKRTQTYRVTQFLEEDEYLSENISEYSDIQFLVLNLSILAYDRAEDLKAFIVGNRLKSKKRCVLFVINADSLLLESAEFISYLNGLTLDNFSFSVFYFLEHPITTSRMLKQWTQYASLYQNLLIVPLPGIEDQKQFVRYACARSNIKISQELKYLIMEKCGGRLWFISEAIRYYARTHDTEHLFDHQEFLMKIRTVLDEYSADERSLLKKVALGEQIFTKTENELLAYFQSTGLIVSDGSYRLSIPVLAEYVKAQSYRERVLRVGENGTLYLASVPILGYFSHREEELLKLFIARGSTVVNRQEVGRILWDQKRGLQYSDWSLDQTIRRLRIKCKKLGLSPDIIRTVKNTGYQWNMQI